jgi:hypothetical protein
VISKANFVLHLIISVKIYLHKGTYCVSAQSSKWLLTIDPEVPHWYSSEAFPRIFPGWNLSAAEQSPSNFLKKKKKFPETMITY